MDKLSLLKQVQELIREAEVERAIDLVALFLDKEKKYKILHREAVQIAAMFNKTRNEEQKGTISFDNAKLNFNQVNDRLLNLLDYIENDNLKPSALLSPAPTILGINKWLVFIGFPMLIAGIIAVFYFTQITGKTAKSDSCVVSFPDTNFNILLLPFYLPAGDPLKIEGLLEDKLNTLSARFGIKTNIQLCQNYEVNKLLPYDEAGKIGLQNKAETVIWGLAEKGAGGNNIVRTRFKYLGNKEGVMVHQSKWEGEKIVDTSRTFSAIISQGDITSDIEQVILLALGIKANQMGNDALAIEALSQVKQVDSSAILVANMILADSYQQTGQTDKAKQSLDTLLRTHPNYWLARNQRGMYNLEKGDYLGAIEDLSVAIDGQKQPDPAIIWARAKAYEQSEQLYPARADYERLRKDYPNMEPVIRQDLEKTNTRIERLESVIKQAETTKTQNISRKQMVEVAEAKRTLGQNKETRQWISKGLETSPTDPKLIAIQIENQLRDGNKIEAKQALLEALKKGVKKEELARQKPAVKLFIEQVAENR
jgi:tetratricopeptide (TPR) repeat protein